MENLRIYQESVNGHPHNSLHSDSDSDTRDDDYCATCGGDEAIINPDYLIWEETIGDYLHLDIQNDSRRHGLPAEQRVWDLENQTPPRYLPCPACGGLNNMERQTNGEATSPLARQLQKAILHEVAKLNDLPPTSWQRAWRLGIAPSLSEAGLRALEHALLSNDKRLLQGATCSPPPLQCMRDWPVEGACSIGFCGWQGDGLNTVAEVEAYFATVCAAADQRLGEPAAVRYFLNWFDESSRDVMRCEMLLEVEREILRRRG